MILNHWFIIIKNLFVFQIKCQCLSLLCKKESCWVFDDGRSKHQTRMIKLPTLVKTKMTFYKDLGGLLRVLRERERERVTNFVKPNMISI